MKTTSSLVLGRTYVNLKKADWDRYRQEVETTLSKRSLPTDCQRDEKLVHTVLLLNAKVVSFADDTQLYSKISYVADCDSLQADLNCVYDWAKTNNMVFNSPKFKYLSFSTNVYITSDYVNAYVWE